MIDSPTLPETDLIETFDQAPTAANYPRASWRLIDSGHLDGATNMAIDEAILEAVMAGETPPTIRFYGWNPACLSLGISQHHGDVDWEACAENGWDVVRRATGGRAILHTNELTYAVCTPKDDPRVEGDIQSSYQRLSAALVLGLENLGVRPQRALGDADDVPQSAKGPVCFDQPANYEITIGMRKLVGSAQMRRRNAILQHGTLPLHGDITQILDALLFQSAAREATRRVLRGQAVTLLDALGKFVSYENAVKEMSNGFAAGLNLELVAGELTKAEQARAAELRETKYASEEWVKRR